MFDFFRDVFDVPDSIDMSGSLWGFIVLIVALISANYLVKQIKSKKNNRKGDKNVVS
jgi:hypothetical protein